MDHRALARRFVAGHALAEERIRDEHEVERLTPARAFADAMALLDVVALSGPLAPALVEKRRADDAEVRVIWARLREAHATVKR